MTTKVGNGESNGRGNKTHQGSKIDTRGHLEIGKRERKSKVYQLDVGKHASKLRQDKITYGQQNRYRSQ